MFYSLRLPAEASVVSLFLLILLFLRFSVVLLDGPPTSQFASMAPTDAVSIKVLLPALPDFSFLGNVLESFPDLICYDFRFTIVL